VLTWSLTPTYTGSAGGVVFTDASGVVWESSGAPTIAASVTAFILVASVHAAGSVGTVTVPASTMTGTTGNILYTNFAVTSYGGAVPSSTVPTIGTLDEYLNVYGANANQVSAGATNAQVQAALDMANTMACRRCGILFTNAGGTLQTFTEYVDGNGSNAVRVRNPPITAVTSVTVTGSDGTSYALTSSQYRFHPETGTIESTVFGSALFAYTDSAEYPANPDISAAAGFPDGFRNVTVVYTGGYTTAPPDLRWAVYEVVDDTLAAVGIRGTDKLPSEDEVRKAMDRRFKTFERIVC